jgi:methionyl-tRNA synthetase
MLMAAGELPPKQVFAHGWLLVGGEKMSKTRANQIFPADLVRDFGVDGFRYFFMADQRFGPDGDLSYEAMVARYNADLANNFGNLANRVLTMAGNYLGGVSPEHREDGPLREEAARAYAGQAEAFARFDFSGGLEAVWGLVRATNAFIEDRAPWALNKAGDAVAVAAVLGDCLEALRIVALLASPVIPTAAAELWRRLGLDGRPEDQRLPAAAAWGLLPGGAHLDKGAPLFPRFEAAPA